MATSIALTLPTEVSKAASSEATTDPGDAGREPFAAAMPKIIRVLLVDNHPLVRDGIKGFLEGEGDIKVVCEAGDGEKAIKLARTLRPDVVVMEVNLPRMDGIKATRTIVIDLPETKVIGLSFIDHDAIVAAMRAAGAVAHIFKEKVVDSLCRLIREQFSTA